jgi:hypothetical protein
MMTAIGEHGWDDTRSPILLALRLFNIPYNFGRAEIMLALLW